MPKRNSPYSDPLMVPTVELAAVLQRWVKEFRADHPTGQGSGRHNGSTNFGPKGWYGYWQLSTHAENVEQSGALEVLAQALDCNPRVFTRILNKESKYTTLGLCDDILAFIERTDAIHNDEIHVVPNPYWNQERWITWYEEEKGACG